MLERNIRKHLDKKVGEWLESIKDEAVRNVLKKNVIVSGGCFVSLLNNEPVHDYDIYFRTKEAVIAAARYYTSIWNKDTKHREAKVYCGDWDTTDGTVWIESERVKIIIQSTGVASEDEATPDKKNPFRILFMSSNAISLSDKIQVVIRFYGEPEKLHHNFDFAHTKAWYDYSKSELSIPARVYETVMNKVLLYDASKYPLCSLFRIRKFIKRGWSIGAGEILKIALTLNGMDLTNIHTLEDQLLGVDTAYFQRFIDIIRGETEEGKALDTHYLVSVIDRVFK